VRHFAVKDPVLGGELRRHVPETVGFEVDYAEFLEEALVEAWELRGSLEGNVGGGEGEEKEREWWVLKPGMSDKGDGVRLFWSEEGLRGIFEGWEGDEEEEKEEEDNDNDPNLTPWSPQTKPTNQPTGIITSHLRHFIAQRYIARPLLFPTLGNRKFHLRSYVLAVGALRVYVFREMLALFAAKPYRAPGNDNDAEPDLGAHLTNTCLQDGDDDNAETSIIPFRDLPPSLPFDGTLAQISHLTSLLFRAATATQSLHFQPLPNAFEVFGVDWLVDEDRKVWLLEANAFPDFGASGDKGRGVVGRFWEGVVGRFWEGVVGVLVGGEGFLGGLGGGVGGVGGREEGVGEEGVGEEGVGEEGVGEEREREEEGKAENGMVKVLDIDLGRR